MILAMTGKGGVGKTTLSALTLNWLSTHGGSPVLAVDADSNANLNEALGVAYDATVGGIRESARKEAAALKGVSKQEFLDLGVENALHLCRIVEVCAFGLEVRQRDTEPVHAFGAIGREARVVLADAPGVAHNLSVRPGSYRVFRVG